MSILNNLCIKLAAEKSELYSFINTAPHRYKSYAIPKRNGTGTRIIAQPSRAVKVLQELALASIAEKLPVHNSAMAYIKGKNIKENAAKHKLNQYILKMDFKDFFHSIKPNDLIEHANKHLGKLDDEDRFMLAKLFFWSPKDGQGSRLSIGAPSSPFISNTILFQFDLRLSNYLAKNNITYTRYADDLTFSTNKRNILSEIPNAVKGICEHLSYPKLTINDSKTIFSSKANNRHITGLVLTNDNKISLGRDKKRAIKSLIFRFSKSELDEKAILNLRGQISFAKHIEPTFYSSLINKYSMTTIQAIQSFQSNNTHTAEPTEKQINN